MKILILENDRQMPDGHAIGHWIEKMQAEDLHEFKYVFNAYNSGKEIAALLPWADTLAFSSTFYYLDKIYKLTELIAKVVSKPLTVIIDNYETEKYIGELLDIAGEKYVKVENLENEDDEDNEDLYEKMQVQELRDKFAYSLRLLKLFQLNLYGTPNLIPITVLNEGIARVQLQIDTRIAYMASRHHEKAKTGKKVKVLDIVAFEKQFNNLKKGMIVDEIDMSEVDERPERGVWVMGVGEPVKLLNDPPYNEYELVVENEMDLAEELCKKCDLPITCANVLVMVGILRLPELESMGKANLICETFKVPKRGNRAVISSRISSQKESI